MVQKIKKYKNKILSFLVAVVALPFFTVNSFAAYDTYPQYVFNLPYVYSQHYANNGSFVANRNFNKGDDSNYYLTHSGTVWDTAFEFLLYLPNTDQSDYIFNFPVNSTIYDYYVFHNFTVDNINNNTVITGYDFGYYDENNNFIVNDVTTDRIDKELIYCSNVTGNNSKSRSYQYTAKLNLNFTGIYNLGVLRYYGNGSLYDADTYIWNLSVIAVNKGTSSDDVNNIISAINNQTNQISSDLGSIDNSIIQGNEIAENGNETTQEIVTEFTEVFDDFNAELDEIESFDDEIIGEFEAANTEYLTTLNNFELTHTVLNAGNWLATSMQTIYDSSSDFKMLWLVPMIFGIPILLFIGKKIKGDDD